MVVCLEWGLSVGREPTLKTVVIMFMTEMTSMLTRQRKAHLGSAFQLLVTIFS